MSALSSRITPQQVGWPDGTPLTLSALRRMYRDLHMTDSQLHRMYVVNIPRDLETTARCLPGFKSNHHFLSTDLANDRVIGIVEMFQIAIKDRTQ